MTWPDHVPRRELRGLPIAEVLAKMTPTDDEPKPNSPADAGYTDEARLPPARPRHDPRYCACGAAILWAQTLALDEDLASPTRGRWLRVRRDDDKGWKSMPVDYEPTAAGNVQVYDRVGEGIVARVYKNAAAAPEGAILRTSHFATCPNAAQHRRKR